MTKLKRDHSGHYTTEDGRFTIEYVDDYETECDEPHPMRISRADREWFAGLDQFDRDRLSRENYAKSWALRSGAKGYFCDGGETHYYARWIVWDNVAEDYPTDTGPDGFDTKRDAVRFLDRLYATEGGDACLSLRFAASTAARLCDGVSREEMIHASTAGSPSRG